MICIVEHLTINNEPSSVDDEGLIEGDLEGSTKNRRICGESGCKKHCADNELDHVQI